MSLLGRAACYWIAIQLLLSAQAVLAKDFVLSSPDDAIQFTIAINRSISLSLNKHSTTLLQPSPISLELNNGPTLGENARILKTQRRTVKQNVKPIVREKRSSIAEHYNELRIDFENHFTLVFRAYNEGVAYRWETHFSNEIMIKNEVFELQFSPKDHILLAETDGFHSNYEDTYHRKPIGALPKKTFGQLPALVQTEAGPKVLITESDLEAYPGLWIRGHGRSGIKGMFAGYPLAFNEQGKVKTHADYIAKTYGQRTFPWRLLVIADHDKDLIGNQMVYLLAKPLAINDPSWIAPGQVILDWWGRRNIFGVDFKPGVNTATMKYFIDFCSEYNIRYFLPDEGWSKARRDILTLNPDVDMQAVTAYAKQKGVGLFLWVHWQGLNDNMPKILDQFAAWGIKGIKVDFMDRDDQQMVEFHHRVAREAAKRQLHVLFHGSYKPTGIRRAYPNVLSREAGIEFEWNGGTNRANPEHHTTLPFTRMVAGPFDYIPGTLHNAQKREFHNNNNHPMGLGTRAHSIALAVILQSPMQMIPDSPSDYYREPEITRFLTQIPVEWDDTVVLDAKVANHISLARRHGDTWYAAAITDWSEKTLQVDFSFLDDGQYLCEIIQDGTNAHERAIDFQRRQITVNNKTVIPIHLAPGGGWIARITKRD
jgi:alpha-glucosidase